MFRKYTKGWKPSFFKDFDDFFEKPTFRDTGRGRSSRPTQSQRTQSDGSEPQTYEEIRQACIESGSLWEDPDFPAQESSLYYENPPSVTDIEWLRPHDVCDDSPSLFVSGASRLDINQGVLGNCWFLAGLAGLASYPRLLHRVVPEQSFEEGEYGGIFKFELWQYGRWIEVLIDDRLPTYNGKLIYVHSNNHNEFWSALLEKAYAKLHGTYEHLSGGLTSEAMTDFTGGVITRYELRDKTPDDLFATMHKARQRASLMGCSIDATPDAMESRLDNGLVIGHAYTITDVRKCQIETPRTSGLIPMVRVRNPWGNEAEWKGAFSDGSDEWQLIPEDERQEMGLSFNDDGEFWMTFHDFKDNFQRVEICYLGPDSVLDDDDGEIAQDVRRWEGTLNESTWRNRVNAGGCSNYPRSFYTNPQYRVTVPEQDEDDEDGLGTVVVGLMQKNRRRLRHTGQDNFAIGYSIYKLDDPNCGTLDYKFFQSNRACARAPAFSNMREVGGSHKLAPGDYVVVPSTFEPNEEAGFLLRVYAEREDEVNEMDDATGSGDRDDEGLSEATDDDVAGMESGLAAFEEMSGRDGEVDAYELQELLNNHFSRDFEFDGFSIDMCRSMVAMRDADLSGKLGHSDFKTMWEDLMLCKRAFKNLDEDGSGYFSSFEFRRVLNTLGLRLSNSTFNAIAMRYSDKEGHVRFDDFVACYIKLRSMFAVFEGKDPDKSGEATFEMDEFVQMTMYS